MISDVNESSNDAVESPVEDTSTGESPRWNEVAVEDVPARRVRPGDQHNLFAELPEFKA